MPQLFKNFGKGNGWRGEPERHALAAKGVKTSRQMVRARSKFIRKNPRKQWFEPPKEYIDYEETLNWHRFRVRDPHDFEPGSFRTVKRDKNNVHIVVARLKGQETTTTQSIRFRKKRV